ncbi:MAG: ParB/RepB/Spo0J family partition protein [bacterium]
MQNKNNTAPRLGRGLEALLSRDPITNNKGDSFLSAGRTIMQLPISLIDPSPYQPRKHFNTEALLQLSNSIKAHGLAQPIVVRRNDKRYEIIAGERRFRATQSAGIDKIPAIIRSYSNQESLQIALIENLDRENLSAIETARGYARLMSEFNVSQQEISQIFNKNRSTISNTLRLLHLPEDVQQLIIKGELSEGHARTLLSAEDSATVRKLSQRIIQEGLSVRACESLIKSLRNDSKNKSSKTPHDQISLFPEITSQLSQKMGAPINIQGNNKKGKITIQYKSPKELDQLLTKLDGI